MLFLVLNILPNKQSIMQFYHREIFELRLLIEKYTV